MCGGFFQSDNLCFSIAVYIVSVINIITDIIGYVLTIILCLSFLSCLFYDPFSLLCWINQMFFYFLFPLSAEKYAFYLKLCCPIQGSLGTCGCLNSNKSVNYLK